MSEKFVGEIVKVFWESEQDWFSGIIDEVSKERGYHIQYFDGDDQWISTLDNVEFDNESLRKNDDANANVTLGIEETEDFDELMIIPDDREDHELEMNAVAEDVEVTELEYDKYQSHNRSAIEAILQRLHERGVAICGTVLGASFFDQDDAGSSVSFKILFIEGGAQPAMFRCKTPVFSSSAKPFASTIYWDDGTYRFDMIMPDDALDPEAFRIQGELMIALYKSRSNGGNDFVGQIAINLAEIVKTGSTERFRAGFEGRALQGEYPLVSRSGQAVGDIFLQLFIAWKQRSGNRSSTRSPSPEPVPRPPKSVAASHRSEVGTRAKSAGASRKTGLTTTTKSKKAEPVRKIVSAQAKKQREDAMRIERENKKLQERLQQHTSKHMKSSHVYGATTVATKASALPSQPHHHLQPPAPPSMAADPKYADFMENQHKQSKGEAKRDAGKEAEKKLQAQLLQIFNTLKRDNAALEQENQSLKAKLSKLKISISKYEQSIDKVKQSDNASVASSRTGARSYRDDAKSIHSARSEQRQKRSSSMVADGKDAIVTSASSAYSDEGADGEYKNLFEEHSVLQNVRRALIERIKTAKIGCEKAEQAAAEATESQSAVAKRLAYMSAAADAKGVDMEQVDEEILLYEQLRALKSEVAQMEGILDSNMHTLSIESQLSELRTIVDVLSASSAAMQKDIDELKATKDAHQTKLKQYSEANVLLHKREFITSMQALLLKITRHEKMVALDEGYKYIELELLRYKLRHKEKYAEAKR